MRPIAFLALPLVVAACAAPIAPSSGPMAQGGMAANWTLGPDGRRAVLPATGDSPQVSIACETSATGSPAPVWTVASPAPDGAGEILRIASSGFSSALGMTGVGGVWRGAVALDDASRQVLRDGSGPVTFTLRSGVSATAANAGPALDIYASCS
ncbi:hypothetical protein ROJ8625_03851 [Roseivivax jejudonensis]|uniref:Uncharacterized protein n=1 Tax=Roseivivax jejudonensis TaxID=1529041 RepID=A0A1X7A7E4_9RHOB|nr:hypothetical protein [Roseivivax jejudonensis]SLN72572.1 hypothetical protein ROJ8625_03851 [Roseivivax jejudonensis]